MKLHSLKVEGFRRHFKTQILCSDATFLIGPNNAGKSSILKAIEYLLNDKKKISVEDFFCILNDDGENKQISDEIIITGEFRNVPQDAINWRGFNKQRLFEYTTEEMDEKNSYSIFYRKIYKPGQNAIIEIKQLKTDLKSEFNECKKIQDYIDKGLEESIVNDLFPEKNNSQNMTKAMLDILKDEGIESLYDIDPTNVEWFKNPGGIVSNVSHRLPKFLLISDKAETNELSASNGALMETLKQLFEDVRDESENFRQAQSYLNELAKELDPNDENSEFSDLLKGLNSVVSDVFPDINFIAEANLSDAEVIKPIFDVQMGSNIKTSVEYQGAGVVRSAIFAMLRYRTIRENQKKKSSEYIRPLLIAFEEPEMYLHPQAAKQMRDTIYDLSVSSNNQIICTTHSPYMIDLGKKTNQVLNSFYLRNQYIESKDDQVKIENVQSNPFNVSKAYSKLIDEEKSHVKMLLKIDDSISKIFFTKNVLIVEGDTEEVVIRETMSRMPEDMYKEFSYNWEVVRARGKATIIPLIKYLKAMGIKPFVIHDRDKNIDGAYVFNKSISEAMGDDERIILLEECIEDLLGYKEPTRDKPYKAFKFISDSWKEKWENVTPEWKSIISELINVSNRIETEYDEVAAGIEND